MQSEPIFFGRSGLLFAKVHTGNKDLGQSKFVLEVHIIRTGARTEVSLDTTPLGSADHVWPDYILQLDKWTMLDLFVDKLGAKTLRPVS